MGRPSGADRSDPLRVESDQVLAQVNAAAVAAAKQRCGWRVYVTNHPELTLPQAVLSYRGQYGIEHGYARLKGKPLELSPMYLQTDDRVVGLLEVPCHVYEGLAGCFSGSD